MRLTPGPYDTAWQALAECRRWLDREAELGRLVEFDSVFGLSVRSGQTEATVRRLIAEGGLAVEIRGGVEMVRIADFEVVLRWHRHNKSVHYTNDEPPAGRESCGGLDNSLGSVTGSNLSRALESQPSHERMTP